MAATSLPVARLLQLRIPIAWQEAVAVAIAAEMRSAADATPITLEQCGISTDGQVHLAPSAALSTGRELSALQLLSALLEGQAAPKELRALAATAGDALASFPSEREDEPRAHADLRHFVSPHPEAEIARLAGRGVAAEHQQEASSPPTRQTGPPLVRVRPRVPMPPVRTHRRPAVTLRVQRRGAAMGLAGLLLTMASGAAAMGALIGGVGWPLVVDVPPTAEQASASSAPGKLARPNVPAPVDAASIAPASSFEDLSVQAFPPDRADTDTVASAAADQPTYSSTDVDVEPPELLQPQLPTAPRADGEGGTSVLELVIDANGLVQQVQLDAAAPSHNDRMIVAAAKAWRFRPATREGHAVPYVLRLPITR